nr:class I SAM-dependent methyltransferase [Streptomyces taklimakanensis]
MGETTEAVWDRYARGKRGVPERTVNAAGQRTWFNWTQYPDHGPTETVLGSPASALELGCGTGRNAAHLAVHGVEVTAVDVSLVPLEKAEQRWGHLGGLRLVHREAVDFLRATDERFGAVYSVFGAVWFTDPEVLLPLVRRALRPGGVLAFSHEPPIEGCYGCQGGYVRGPGGDRPSVVRRWAYTPAMWVDILARYGFTRITADIVAPPPARSGDVPTLLVHARV